MIPDLLWRCPLCASNDALRHSQRWLHREVVDCTACGAQWRVRRVVGDNYYLKLARSGEAATAFLPGVELSITSWYDLMKQTVRLEALPQEALPEPLQLLDTGERLYLASRQATLGVVAAPGMAAPGMAPPAFSKAESLHPAAAGISPRSGAHLPVPLNKDGQVSLGRLFLSNRRIIWQPSSTTGENPKPSADLSPLSFPLRQVNGVYAIMNIGLSMVVGVQLYYLSFANESPLKWVTYVALLVAQIKAETGHTIQTSHY